MLKLIVLDADRTIWSHYDASSLIPPFKKINDNLIIDKYESRVELNHGLRDFLEHFINLGIYFLSLAGIFQKMFLSFWNFLTSLNILLILLWGLLQIRV